MKAIRTLIVAAVFLIGFATVAPAQIDSVGLEVQPRGFIPLRSSSDIFTIGGGGTLAATFDANGPLYARAGVGYSLLPTPGPSSASIVTGRVGGGLRLDLGSLLAYRVGLMAGGFYALYGDLNGGFPSFAAETSLSARLSSSFDVGVGVGYEYHVGTISVDGGFSETSFAEGLSVFAGATFRPGNRAGGSGERRPRLEIEPPRFDPVFPVFYRYYNDNPLGSVTITNEERVPITNVKVSFLVNQYMDAPKLSASIEQLEPGESVEVPLLALLRDSVLGITEGTSVNSEVIVEYEDGDDLLTASRNETIRILNRNNMTWDDDRKAAAFVTSNDPTVLRFARNITAAIRSESVTAVNERLRTAMGIFQALNLYGLEYVIDPDSSYVELSESESSLDYLQFPQQTLDYRTGDCDDLSILYAALLESVGIRTAFITIPGHIYTAFALDMDEQEARNTFARPEDLIFIDEEAWVPVEITLVRSDFLDAWSTGAKQWRESDAAGTAAVYPVRAAWSAYEPTGFASQALAIDVPQTTEVVPNYTAVLREFIDREIGPQVVELEERISASNGNPRLINRLGTVYARYGLYEEAEVAFLRALERREYVPALVNLGNISYLREEPRSALEYFTRARDARDGDPEVLINLARVHFDLEEYAPAVELYRQAEVIAPELAREFNYIVSENLDSARASAAQARRKVIWDEE